MNRFVEIRKPGPPSVLELSTEKVPDCQDTEIVIENKSIGFNFIDTYFRSGLYEAALPFRPGSEGAGIVHAVGSKTSGFKVGDRVCYLGKGSYADYTVVDQSRVAKLPDDVSFEVAAASLLKGLTAQYLLEIYKPQKGEFVVFHAGAGGVGLIFLQWARSLGVNVVVTVSSQAKAELAKENGAYEALLYSDDLVSKVEALNGGNKVKVVYDSVGKDTFMQSIDCLAPRGLLVSFGNASGPVAPFPLTLLSQKGSLFVTRPVLAHYISDFQKQVSDFFELVSSGVIKLSVNQKYSLEDVQQLHTDAEARKLSGSTVLYP